MGHVYNKSYFRKNKDTKEFIIKLHPQISIIQSHRFCSKNEFVEKFGGYGFEGVPMFDNNGQIIGMRFTNEENSQLGIHVSLLKHFM